MYSHGYVICPSSQYKWSKKEAAAQQVDFYNNLSLYSVVLKFDEQPQNSVSIDSVLMGDESGFWLLTLFIPCFFWYKLEFGRGLNLQFYCLCLLACTSPQSKPFNQPLFGIPPSTFGIDSVVLFGFELVASLQPWLKNTHSGILLSFTWRNRTDNYCNTRIMCYSQLK